MSCLRVSVAGIDWLWSLMTTSWFREKVGRADIMSSSFSPPFSKGSIAAVIVGLVTLRSPAFWYFLGTVSKLVNLQMTIRIGQMIDWLCDGPYFKADDLILLFSPPPSPFACSFSTRSWMSLRSEPLAAFPLFFGGYCGKSVCILLKYNSI